MKKVTIIIAFVLMAVSCKDKGSDVAATSAKAASSGVVEAPSAPKPVARPTPKPTADDDDAPNPACATLKLGPSDLGPFNVVSSSSVDGGCMVVVEATAEIPKEIHLRVTYKDKDGVKLHEGWARVEHMAQGEKQKIGVNVPDDAVTIGLIKDF